MDARSVLGPSGHRPSGPPEARFIHQCVVYVLVYRPIVAPGLDGCRGPPIPIRLSRAMSESTPAVKPLGFDNQSLARRLAARCRRHVGWRSPSWVTHTWYSVVLVPSLPVNSGLLPRQLVRRRGPRRPPGAAAAGRCAAAADWRAGDSRAGDSRSPEQPVCPEQPVRR